MIGLLLLFIFTTRLPYLTHSPFESGESWRQGDTESMARNFVEERFNLFFPQLNYDGAAPNYAQLEFQITTFLIAILYKIFGISYLFARLVPLLFFIGSAYFLYLITKKYYPVETAWLSTALYAIFPLNVYFSRAIMPESAALFFFLGAFYFFNEWIEKEKNWLIVTSALMTALAIAVKTPAIFVGIPMLAMSLIKYRKRIFFIWQLCFFAGVSLLLPFIYFKWLESVAEFTFVSNIGAKHIIPEFATALFTPEALTFFQTHLPKSFTLISLLLFMIGVLTINWKKEYPIAILMIAIILEVITIVAVIRFPYYLIFLGPIVAIIAGKGLAYLLRIRFGSVPIMLILGIISFSSYTGVEAMFEEKVTLLTQAEIVKEKTEKEDLIVVGTFSPDLINASERKGWRANINYYDFIPQGPEAELQYFIEHGAKYFIPAQGYIYNDKDGEYHHYLEKNFEKISVIHDGKDYSFYRLQ